MTQEAINNAIVLYRLKIERAEVEKADEIFFIEPQLQKVLASPVVSNDKKNSIIDKVYKDAGLSKNLTGFIKMMCKLGFAVDFRDIFDAYYKYDDEANKILRASLISAEPASDELVENAKKILADKYPEYKIVLTKDVDESLLGGYVIKLQGIEIDKSYEGMLRQLERKIIGR